MVNTFVITVMPKIKSNILKILVTKKISVRTKGFQPSSPKNKIQMVWLTAGLGVVGKQRIFLVDCFCSEIHILNSHTYNQKKHMYVALKVFRVILWDCLN